jgi:hypothetical protein
MILKGTNIKERHTRCYHCKFPGNITVMVEQPITLDIEYYGKGVHCVFDEARRRKVWEQQHQRQCPKCGKIDTYNAPYVYLIPIDEYLELIDND